LDLASFDSVRRFAADIIQTESQIHVLINNAGVSSPFKKELTKDGIELQMQSNHFGHFLLTNLLLGKQTCQTI
jgi:retinol dehydrogenase 12